ncbi:hypothetical protein [Flavobacterium sp. NRK1]|uniref:hypothetical protein n=1 Tax=Flavobacterium sp. NRK1 TaxID=2954929 RepID=UPI0020920BEF|nr:hypothetical protein [Flavobacterium sp. NRK1]MCO6149539.1 hypothetical protein [Flavobacterium sp. NRK1]
MENLNEKIKLPSNWMLVNPESIWRYLLTISKTGNVFSKEQLIKSGLYTNNEDNISRNLSYLKYLGIVEEERGKGKNQKFLVNENSYVRNITYELKAGREDAAKDKLKEHFKNHILFQTLKSEFFKNEKEKTLHELEHFLKDGIPNKSPVYYQKGGEFLIKLLSIASLATLSGNDILLNDDNDNQIIVNDDDVESNAEIISSNVETNPSIPQPYFDEALIVPSNVYTIKFVGPGMNTTLEIQEEDDLLIVEATLVKIRKKLLANASN